MPKLTPGVKGRLMSVLKVAKLSFHFGFIPFILYLDTTLQPYIWFPVMKILLACDFDHTIIDDNSDTWIVQLCPDKRVPGDIQAQYDIHHNWTVFMDEIFKFMHSKAVTADEILDHMRNIPFVNGMKELLQYQAKSRPIDCIIISDSNKIFIDCILGRVNMLKSLDSVYTNPAEFTDGCLSVHPYHKHKCKRCPANLCKSQVLQEHLQQCKEAGRMYDVVVFVGDGGNDFCPCLSLNENDFVFARKGFRLEKKLAKFTVEEHQELKAKVNIWESGLEIQSHLQELLSG